MKRLCCTLMAALFLWGQTSSLAAAQLFPPPDQHRPAPLGGSGNNRCANISVEPQIDMHHRDGSLDRTARVVDFTITVFVTNQCPEPVQLLHGSFVSYRTNFPAFVQELSQPPECLGQQRSFSGLAPPLQKVPFTFRVQGCTLPTSYHEGPRVTVETGRIMTDRGDKPIPTTSQVLP